MELSNEDLGRFRRGLEDVRKFWARFGETPDFRGQRVLEVGSGFGALAISIGLSGARRVVAVDVSARAIEFAAANLRQNYPQLSRVVQFKATAVGDLGEGPFDCIVSKDTFEHVMDLDSVLAEMRRRLAPGGRIYAGFGPIYTSPYGDHDRRRKAFEPMGWRGRALARIPWGHLFLESKIIAMANRNGGRKASSMRDLNLNTRSASDYRRAFAASGLDTLEYRTNQSTRLTSKILSVTSMLPFLEDYCTHNIYCVLKKPAS